ncbi:transporter [Sporocytophaga myxococcoides]|uniref:transporter n=1 Tax=Sporocytophaga myxococcoides TaxID=153721 RepID=UPI00041C14A6|nr:transporter [Sporocytophaga myxococcoides]
MQMQFRLCLLFIFVIHIAYGQSDSQEVCSAHCCFDDPTPAGVMISHAHEKGEWMFSYRFMAMDMKNVLEGSHKVTSDHVFNNYLMYPDHMRMDMHMLMAMYGLSDKITLMAMLNYNYNRMTMTMHPGMQHNHGGTSEESSAMKMKTSGLGDIKLSLIYNLLNKNNSQLLLSPGISIPVGRINITGNAENMYDGIRLPYVMQMGSGTWDFTPVINYFYNKTRFSFSSQVSSIIRLNTNNLGYKLGNELTLNNWIAYKWSKPFSSSARLEACSLQPIKGEDKDLPKDYEPGSNPANYGGEKAFLYLGTNYYLNTSFLTGSKIGLEFGLPVYQNLNGPQMAQRFTLFASYSITL